MFPESIGEYWTTLSYGYDVSKTIAALIGNAHAMNETFHIAGAPSVKWKEILKRYVCILETVTGEKPKVLIYDDIEDYSKRTRRITQLKYDRLSNRVFDNSKVESVIGLNSEMYREPGGGVEICLKEFLKKPVWRRISSREEAYCDRLCKERTPLKTFPGIKEKVKYVIFRYMPYFR